MRRLSRDPWFHDKLIGWGLSPAGWQGWVATGVFVVVFALTMAGPLRGAVSLRALLAAAEVVAFITLAYLTSTHVEPR